MSLHGSWRSKKPVWIPFALSPQELCIAPDSGFPICTVSFLTHDNHIPSKSTEKINEMLFKKCFWIFKWKRLCKYKWYIILFSNSKIWIWIYPMLFFPFAITHWAVNRPKWVIIWVLWFLTEYYQKAVVFYLAHLVWHLI